MTMIDFSLDESNFRAAQDFVNACLTRKGVRLPESVAPALATFKLKQFTTDPTPNQVFEALMGALTSAGASQSDAASFAGCIRSMLDTHGGNVEEFIRRGFGYVSFGTEGKQFALVPKVLTAGAASSEAFWSGEFALPKDLDGNPLPGVAVEVIFTQVPAWVVVAVSAAALLIMIATLPGGGGKSWLEQAMDGIANVFGW